MACRSLRLFQPHGGRDLLCPEAGKASVEGKETSVGMWNLNWVSSMQKPGGQSNLGKELRSKRNELGSEYCSDILQCKNAVSQLVFYCGKTYMK